MNKLESDGSVDEVCFVRSLISQRERERERQVGEARMLGNIQFWSIYV
jgi:hypothetical protein